MAKKKESIAELKASLENSVFVSNAFMRHMSDLTLTEAKIVRYLIMRVNNTDKEFKEEVIEVKNFAKLIGVKPQNLYKRTNSKEIKEDKVKDICAQLYGRRLFIEDPNDPSHWLVFGWLAYAEHEKGVMKFKLNEKLRDYFLYLKKHFTAYKLEEIISFRSVHSIRVYEILLWALSEGKMKKPRDDEQRQVYIPLDIFKKYLGVEDKYNKPSHFKLRILNPALEDINERSCAYHISCRDEKCGKSIVGFTFFIETVTNYEKRMLLEDSENKQLSFAVDGRYIKVVQE